MSTDREPESTTAEAAPEDVASDEAASDGTTSDEAASGEARSDEAGSGQSAVRPEAGDPQEPAGTAESGDTPLPRRRIGLVALVAVLVLAVDIVTKVIVTATLEGEPPVEILGGLVYLQLVRNGGAAFGMDIGGTWLLAIIAMIVVAVIIWFARRLRSTGWAIGLGLVLAGALGNLVDRIFRAPAVLHGHVVDFVSVLEPNGDFFPVFNAADSAITIGACLIVLLSLMGRDYDGTRAKEKKADE